MALFHLSAQPISRASGRSATAAAAYRAGVEIIDERTGQVHDYTRKAGVVHSEIILPGGGTADRAEFWNSIEKHHKRGDAVLSREVEVSLPTELTKEERQALAVGFARELAERYGVAADVALHAPRTVTDKDLEKEPGQYYETDPATGRRHNGNWHAHIMLSACHVSPAGDLGKKAVELDPIHCQRAKIENMADRERVRWAHLANTALERAGHTERIDHRTLEAQGIERKPSIHLGPAATGIERRGEVSQKTENLQKRQDAAAKAVAALTANSQTRTAAALKAAAQVTADALKKIQAAALATEQARAAAEQAAERLTAAAEAKEKDDGIRNAALGALAKASRATDRNVRATGAAWDSTVSAVHTSASNIRHSQEIVRSAAKGAEQRLTRRHFESSAPAVAKQLGNVGHVLQQLVDHLPAIVKSIATAAQAVARQVTKRLAKAPVKAIPSVKPEKPPTAVLEPSLTDSDRALIALLDEAADRRDKKAAASMSKLEVVRKAAEAAFSRERPREFDWNQAGQAARNASAAAARLDVNASAVTRGITSSVPYPSGADGPWAMEHYSSFETALKKATNEVGYHAREPRPEGFFKKKETAAYDLKTADLQRKANAWAEAIDWRSGAIKAACAARAPQEDAHVVGAKFDHDREQAPAAEKAAPLRARSEALGREVTRLREKMDLVFGKEQNNEKGSGMDFER